MASFGLAGWTAVLLPTYLPAALPPVVRASGTLSFLLFFSVIVASRGLAFRVLPETLVSLDSAFYIAAVVCLGSVSAGRLVALALILDALLRLLGKDTTTRRAQKAWAEHLLFVIYFSGMTGGMVMAVGWVFQVDGRTLLQRPEMQWAVLAVVLALGAVFLLCHYVIQGGRLLLAGHPIRQYLRRMALPGILSEASLLPLAAVVVLIYHPGQPMGFVLLGATYLLLNFVFNRLSHASASLRERVRELETLNRTAHALGSSLELPAIIEALARETLASIPEAERLTLVHRQGDGFVTDRYDRERKTFERLSATDGSVVAWMSEHRRPLCLADASQTGREVGLGSPADVRSWLGVPIVIYHEVVGVLSVESRESDVFVKHQARLLEAIGAQAAVAIENARLYALATVDGLTGLYVRRYFDTRLAEELERSKRFGTPFGLVLLDIDDFKKLNDTYGHNIGDRALREVAQVVQRSLRGVDIAARYGGEEFAFILPRTSIVDAHAVAERIRQDVSEVRVSWENQVIGLTASLGVSCYPDSGPKDAAALVHLADIALYRAKATGKNRVELYWGAEGPTARRLRPIE
jgi:diguanylate cyclase (GGDEF)-like protein